MKKRILSLAICLCVFFSMTCTSLALDSSPSMDSSTTMPRFQNIWFTNEDAWHEDGEVFIRGYIQAYSSIDMKITFKIEYTNGNGWKTLKTVSKRATAEYLNFEYSLPCGTKEAYRITIQYNVGTDKPSKVKYVNT